MSEEKKAIETLKEVASDDFDTLGDDISPKMAQNILNVIDKQQKEIEEYKEHYENMKWYYDNQKNNLIHKDKIKEIIENAEADIDYLTHDLIEDLKKILEEK